MPIGKTPPDGGDSAASVFRTIPSVDRVLALSPFVALSEEFGRTRVKESVTAHFDELRRRRVAYDQAAAVEAVRSLAAAATSSTLRRTINASGVIIHTNLGRAPVDRAIWAEAEAIVAGYSNLEFDLERGERGTRHDHLAAICATLFGAEAAVLTNNNAAGTLLLLAATAANREVIVSRGELVEIGGGFRVPDVIQQGGARLREVGTTNRTRASDYREALGSATAALLRVHRSNFEIVGFTESPPVEEMIAVARDGGVPMLYDEGSGRVVDLEKYGFARGETIRELLAKGVDAVTCSTDKLIGATQGGLILGREEIVARCRKHPLMRAMRAGKESYAIVAATLRAFATERHEQRIPIYRMLSTPLDMLRTCAEDLVRGTQCRVVESRCALGGGTTPAETIPSVAIEVPGNPDETYARFLGLEPPVVGRIVDDRFTLDVRTLLDDDLPHVAAALR